MIPKKYQNLACVGIIAIIILVVRENYKHYVYWKIQHSILKTYYSIKGYAAPDNKYINSKIPLVDRMTRNDTYPFIHFVPKAYNSSGPNLKKILFWNYAYDSKSRNFGLGQEIFIKAGCKINTCFATSEREQFNLEEVDAVVWQFRSIDRSLPLKRSNKTRYIFWMMESADYLFGNLEDYNGVFNWTMTHRLDSDIPNPYGLFRKLKYPKINVKENYNYLANKTVMAVWFVSNCHAKSHRERLVKKLQNYIHIDIYGSCGTMKCERNISAQCMKKAEKDYKFYLSFENSLCLDYVTEKFYIPMQYNIVPVVYGLGQYESIAPPHSYINALDFNTAKELAEYLIYLDNNPDKYNEYFIWKNYFLSVQSWKAKAISFCTLCEMLHNETLAPHVYHNIHQWFVKESKCMHVNDPKINKLIS